MYWSPNFLTVVFKTQEISRPRNPTNKHSSHQNAGFSIWVFENFPAVIPPAPHSERGATPSRTQHPALPLAGRGAQAPRCWDSSPWSPSTFQPWLRPCQCPKVRPQLSGRRLLNTYTFRTADDIFKYETTRPTCCSPSSNPNPKPCFFPTSNLWLNAFPYLRLSF